MKSVLLATAIFAITTHAFALTRAQETALGHAAGEYYGAVAMNEEFKKSRCGNYLKIPSVWYDTSYAMQDIRNTIPNSVKDKNEALRTLPKDAEPLRSDLRRDLGKANDQQCQIMAKRIYNITTPLIIKWNDMK